MPLARGHEFTDMVGYSALSQRDEALGADTARFLAL
jgi:hypothetical protein